jgi:hypothetical protein
VTNTGSTPVSTSPSAPDAGATWAGSTYNRLEGRARPPVAFVTTVGMTGLSHGGGEALVLVPCTAAPAATTSPRPSPARPRLDAADESRAAAVATG